MFTGLVEEVGSLLTIRRKGEAMVLDLSAKTIMDDVKIGDSIAVNGVCLTVISFDKTTFAVDVMPQTFRHTNLKDLSSGSKVNLERAMAANGRFGGHIVQGHVDGTGIIQNKTRDQNAVVYTIVPNDPKLFRYIIPQGSITIDGISLTVADAKQDSFYVSIIPHTLEATALAYKGTGDTVNLECDVMGKYIEHLLKMGPADQDGDQGKKASKLDMPFLVENGFI